MLVRDREENVEFNQRLIVPWCIDDQRRLITRSPFTFEFNLPIYLTFAEDIVAVFLRDVLFVGVAGCCGKCRALPEVPLTVDGTVSSADRRF